jgi:hypothetical protein
MTIKLKNDEGYSYHALDGGILTEADKSRANQIYAQAEKELAQIKEKKSEALKVWYLRGRLANSLINKFGISRQEEEYFWLMLFDCAGQNVPKRAKKDGILRNDFWIGAYLENHYNLSELQNLGFAWSLWQEIFGSRPVKNDIRVAGWLVEYMVHNDLSTRDALRPVLKAVGERLKNLNTTILSEKELAIKLKEITQ